MLYLITMNPKYYLKDYQNKANAWWRTLSINEMKALEKKHKAIVINGLALKSDIAMMFEKENP